MPEDRNSFCRACECACGVVATVDGDRLVAVRGDPTCAIGAGHVCPTGTDVAPVMSRRLRSPSVGGVDASWDAALDAAAARLRGVPVGRVAVVAGADVARSAADLVRASALARLFGGTLWCAWAPEVTTALAAAREVVGVPAVLQADLARAHYTVLLGGSQDDGRWGPMLGGNHGPALFAAQRRRTAKLVVADPAQTPLASRADVHLKLRPGTDLFLLLGLLHAVVHGGWHDAQFVAEHCAGFDELKAAIAPWSPERVAGVCGIEPGAISGVALKLARAPMATVHGGRGTVYGGEAGLAAWARLALHAVTANLLRPGGLFEATGTVDVRAGVGLAGAVVGSDLGFGSVDALARRIEAGEVDALVCLYADPTRDLPGGVDLSALRSLIVCDRWASALTARADVVLPGVHPFEQAGSHLVDGALLPVRYTREVGPVVAPPGSARPLAATVAGLVARARPPVLRGGAGLIGRAAARFAATADLGWWEERAWDVLGEADRPEPDGDGVLVGDIDRTAWNVGHADGRLHLLPDGVAAALAALREPAPSLRPLRLAGRSGFASGPLPTAATPRSELVVELSASAAASAGVADGDAVRVVSDHGAVHACVAVRDDLREDVARMPFLWGPALDLGGLPDTPLRLVSADGDRLAGLARRSGVPVTVEKT